ncbi:MAG: hypothetical protein IPL12_14610 [Bacteroidetes bacterium]|nr:hypothetical protein [Bacteroidota bacterium]
MEFEKNKFWISGSSYSNDGDILGSHGSGEAWTVVVDSLGETLWSRSYGGSNVDTWYDGYRIDENSIAFCGTTSSEDGDVIGYEGLPSFPDYWIIVLDSIGKLNGKDVLVDLEQINVMLLIIRLITALYSLDTFFT